MIQLQYMTFLCQVIAVIPNTKIASVKKYSLIRNAHLCFPVYVESSFASIVLHLLKNMTEICCILFLLFHLKSLISFISPAFLHCSLSQGLDKRLEFALYKFFFSKFNSFSFFGDFDERYLYDIIGRMATQKTPLTSGSLRHQTQEHRAQLQPDDVRVGVW